ncbi:MAG: cell division protein ZapB [Desulfosalsimonadaceae bacterium]|nr:cell division protein ZapB [Desulfosalsimonadaceae bacterium]
MDNNNVMRQFDQIEEKVGNLIERCSLLEKLNFELSVKVKSLEAELTEKVETENKHSEQKALIRSKIDNILSKLDNFNENKTE